MRLLITVEVDEDSEYADPSHETGVTEEGFLRLSGYTEHGAGALQWLGEVQDVRREDPA